MLSSVNQVEKKDNDFKNPQTEDFLEKYKEKKEEPKEEKKEEVEVEVEKEEDKVNKDALFKQQAERLASLQKAFMDSQQKEFADLELTTLKNTILDIIKKLEVPVLCDKNNKEKTQEICKKKDIKKRSTRSGTVLFFDTIDITKYAENFYDRKINYFEQQYSFVSKILTNDITLKAYSDGKILSPTIDAIKEFHAQFSSNNRSYWKTRAENFRIDKNNEKNIRIQKRNDQLEAIDIFMYAGIAFGAFFSIMIFVIFYRIERNLYKISELNMNVLEKLKK